MKISYVLVGLLVAGALSSCQQDTPLELYRDTTASAAGITVIFYVVPSSVRQTDDESIITTSMQFFGVRPNSKEAQVVPASAKIIYAFKCKQRTYRQMQYEVTSFDGRVMSRNGDSGEVLPNSAEDLAMDYACASVIGRLWMTYTKHPVIRNKD